MKKKLFITGGVILGLIIVFFAIVFIFGRTANVPEPKTILNIEKGAVQVNGKEAKNNVVLKSGDVVKTEADSLAVINFFDKSTSRLDSNTEIIITKLTSGNEGAKTEVGVRVALGHVWSRIVKLVDKESKFEVETPTTVATVRGTAFDTSVNADGKENLVVTENIVTANVKDTSDPTKMIASTEITQGNRASIDSKNMPKTPMEMMGVVAATGEEQLKDQWTTQNRKMDKNFEETVKQKEEETLKAKAGITSDSSLYGLKNFSQQVRLSLAVSDSSKANLAAEFANQKLAEAGKMIAEGKGEAAKKVMGNYNKGMETAIANLDNLKNSGNAKAYETISQKIQEQMTAQKNLVATTLPDNPLYQIKQKIEETQIKSALETEDKVSLELEQAKERLKEAKKLIEEDKNDLAKDTLAKYATSFEEAKKHAEEVVKAQNSEVSGKMMDEATAKTMETQLFLKTMEESAPPEIQVQINEQKIRGLEQAKEMMASIPEKMQQFQQEMMRTGATNVSNAPDWIKDMEAEREKIKAEIMKSLPAGMSLPAGFVIPDFGPPAGAATGGGGTSAIPDFSKLIPQNFQPTAIPTIGGGSYAPLPGVPVTQGAPKEVQEQIQKQIQEQINQATKGAPIPPNGGGSIPNTPTPPTSIPYGGLPDNYVPPTSIPTGFPPR